MGLGQMTGRGIGRGMGRGIGLDVDAGGGVPSMCRSALVGFPGGTREGRARERGWRAAVPLIAIALLLAPFACLMSALAGSTALAQPPATTASDAPLMGHAAPHPSASEVIERLSPYTGRFIGLGASPAGGVDGFLAMCGPMTARLDGDGVLVRTGAPEGGQGASELRVRFLGASGARPSGERPLGSTTSLLVGNDPSRHVAGAPDYAVVTYRGLWPGVDLVYRIEGGALKYDVLLEPYADLARVQLSYEGARELEVDDATGDLIARTDGGEVRDHAPVAFQEVGGVRHPVGCAFRLLTECAVGFEVEGRDETLPLVIDPAIEHSTYLGGTAVENGIKVALGKDGTVYAMGHTQSQDFPITPITYDNQVAGQDLYVCALTSDLSRVLYGTFIGGSDTDYCYGMYVDPSGAVYLTGETRSTDLPVSLSAYDRTYNGNTDAFVLKLNASGSALDYATYLGSISDDRGWKVVADGKGEACVVGTTWSMAFPTTAGAFDRSWNGGVYDAFVARLSAPGDRLVFSTFLGAENYDAGEAIALGQDGNILVAGTTRSMGFPVSADAYDESYNARFDGYALWLSGDGSEVLRSTYIGGFYEDTILDVALGPDGSVYLTGHTTGNDYPTTEGAFCRTLTGERDIIVSRLSANLTTLLSSTYIGGSLDDYGIVLAVDARGSAYVVGQTASADLPTTDGAIDPVQNGALDGLLIKLNSSCALEHSTFLGGSKFDRTSSVALDPAGKVYMTGWTSSGNFPTTAGAHQTQLAGSSDAFVMSLVLDLPPRWLALPSLEAVEDVPLTFDFSPYVADPDTPLSVLTVSSRSPYVVASAGRTLTFLFTEGVTAAAVPIGVSDGFSVVPAVVNVTVQPVNDPPTCDIPREYTATEDVPMTVSFGPHVRDVDTPFDQLRLRTRDPYASIDGLDLTVLFPEGVREHFLTVEVSDGQAGVLVLLHFTVTPVDDPPTVAGLEEFTAVEDRPTPLDLTRFLRDEDTPIDALTVEVRDPNCTVSGQVLTFLYHLGGFDTVVVVLVSDMTTTVPFELLVHVQEVNDPPIVSAVPNLLAREDEAVDLDLAPYVSDEDTPLYRLTVRLENSAVVRVTGLVVTLLFPAWVEGQDVGFTVFDGISGTAGSFHVQVIEVNDPPHIVAVGDHYPPISISMDTGASLLLPIIVEDEDDVLFDYDLETAWPGATAYPNGTLSLKALAGSPTNVTVTLKVSDRRGGYDEELLSIHIRARTNSPPEMPVVLSPANGSRFQEGEAIAFSVQVADPDMADGQVLSVYWTSDVTGLLRSLTTQNDTGFTTSTLPVGVHRITVRVSDGELFREARVEIEVVKAPTDGDGGDDGVDDGGSLLVRNSSIILAIAVALLVASAIMLYEVRKERRAG